MDYRMIFQLGQSHINTYNCILIKVDLQRLIIVNQDYDIGGQIQSLQTMFNEANKIAYDYLCKLIIIQNDM